MKAKIITEDGKRYLVVPSHENITYGFISKTGKSFVYRIMGTYLNSRGETIGQEGMMTSYINMKIPFVRPIKERTHFGKRDNVPFEFLEDVISLGIKIPIH